MNNIKTLSTSVFVLLSALRSYSMDVVTDINRIVDGYGHTGLHIAAQNGDVASAKKLIVSGADVNLTDNNGKTPLHLAACKNVECVELLIRAGAEIDRADPYWGWTPLHWSISLGKPDCLKALIAAGADINKQASEKCNGYTPLCLAASIHNWQSVANKNNVEILISAGAQVTKPDDNGNTPLHAAIINRHNEIAQILIEHCLENAIDILFNNYSLNDLRELLTIAKKIKNKRLAELAMFKINSSSLMLASVERLGNNSPASLLATNPTLTQQFYDLFYDLTITPIEQFVQKIIKQIENQRSNGSRSVLFKLNQQNPNQRNKKTISNI